ncbi:MAG: succinylglutamate desuccinylase/aspartoacylase family protein [Verrucomicrobiota bacterium]
MMLKSREFVGGKDGPRLLITGGVHGDEFEPMASTRRLIEMFDDDPQLRERLRGTLHIVPVVNEPAFLRGHRVAEEDQLDLARVCPGNPDGSITERIAAALSKLIGQADYYIDLHTGGTELSVWPLAGYGLVDDLEIREMQHKMALAFNLPLVWGTSAKLDGRSMSVARDANVPAIYAEYFGSATMLRQGVDDYVDGCLNVMGLIGMLDHEKQGHRVEHVIIDDRPESGFMQICNPSPMTGFFKPLVEPGDTIQEGQLFGTVVDVLGDERMEVRAENSGLVVVLRTFPRVQKGDSLGVIAEFNEF